MVKERSPEAAEPQDQERGRRKSLGTQEVHCHLWEKGLLTRSPSTPDGRLRCFSVRKGVGDQDTGSLSLPPAHRLTPTLRWSVRAKYAARAPVRAGS